jgi:hypothetical protein
MSVSKLEFERMRDRVSGIKTDQPVLRESDLHTDIREYCDKQWPRWKFIEARFGQRSTIAIGFQDFTIFLPNGKVLCVECKRKGQKARQRPAIMALRDGQARS